MRTSAEQTEIPGCEDPQRIHEVDEVLFAWIDAKAAQKKAADATKIRHLTLLASLAERGLDRYGYLDQFTGKKRFVVVKREPKAATTNAPKPPKKRERKRLEVETRVPDENRVEHRKVSRESVQDIVDPFGAVRKEMR